MFAQPAAARRPSSARATHGAATLPLSLRWWVLVCVVSLLGFQSMGLVHRALHGGSVPPRVQLAQWAQVLHHGQYGPQADTTASLALSADPAVTPPESKSTSGPNLGHVAGSSDCQLLDQLSTALGPIAQAMAWTALLPDFPVASPQPHSAAVAQVWRAPARAPPLA